MDTAAPIEDFLLNEVRYSIPAQLLGLLGDKADLERHIGNHLTVAKETLGENVDVFLWRDVSRYIVNKIRFSIFEVYGEGEYKVAPEPHCVEICCGYRDADQVAEVTWVGIKQTWRIYQLMRRS